SRSRKVLRVTTRDGAPASVKIRFVLRDAKHALFQQKEIEQEIALADRSNIEVSAEFTKIPPFVVNISSNVVPVTVRVGRRRVGTIKDAQQPLMYTYRGGPRTLVFTLRPNDRKVQPRVLRKQVVLSKTQSEYQIEGSFRQPEPPPPPPPPRQRVEPIRPRPVLRRRAEPVRRPTVRSSLVAKATPAPTYEVRASANVLGIVVSFRGQSKTITDLKQPVTFSYKGRVPATHALEFRAPKGKGISPTQIRRRVRFRKEELSYPVVASFEQKQIQEVTRLIQPRCFRNERQRRDVVLKASAGTTFFLKSSTLRDCRNEVLAKAGKSGAIRVSLPYGFVRVAAVAPNSNRVEKAFEVLRGRSSMKVSFFMGGKPCNLKRIRAKVRNKIFLEEEEVNCLRRIPKGHAQYFSSILSLARLFCQKRAYKTGLIHLKKLYENPRNRFQPYPALSLGLEYGRCRDFSRAISLLRSAERNAVRFSTKDRYPNQKAIYKAKSLFYEKLYYRKKKVEHLRQALKSTERLLDILRSPDRREKKMAKKESVRLRAILSKKGGIDE
ncbi:MAG: hypothetical protein AAGJ35_08195, partial [Myxococcota bacterium]